MCRMAAPRKHTLETLSPDMPKALVSGERQRRFVAALMKGHTPDQIARKLAPNNPKRQRYIRGQVLFSAAHSPEFLQWQSSQAKGEVIMGVPGMGAALVKRAHRGRTDAIKLGLELTDIHNPRVKHDHSGDININLNMPRPGKVENKTALDDPNIVDAEVVED